MSKYQFLRKLSPSKALLCKDGRLFVASYSVFGNLPEVLVFHSNPVGEVTNWSEVDGGYGYTSLASFLIENIEDADRMGDTLQKAFPC